MKLVELLARELDVWPEGYSYVAQDGEWLDCQIAAYEVKPTHSENEWGVAGDPDFKYTYPDIDDAELATDHATAIITRADWQAERERIAGGWIAWGGGECPVAEGVRVDVRYRCAKEDMNSGALETIGCQSQNWLDENHRYDIIAYRLHKPEQASAEAIESGIAAAYAGQVKPIEEVKAMHEYNPIHTRNRILEIDRTTEALEEERVQLVQRLADEGFKLLPVLGHSEPEEDMSDWRNWREGDIVECVDSSFGFISVGEAYSITGFTGESIEFLDDDGDEMDYACSAFKFHSRPTA